MERRQVSPVVMRYGFSLVMLMSKLKKDPDMLDKLGAGLTRIQGQAEHFGPTHENVIASLGELFTSRPSPPSATGSWCRATPACCSNA